MKFPALNFAPLAFALLLLAACATTPAAPPLCATDGVRLDVGFEGAGQHECMSAAEGRFELSVTPEAAEINPSPWYAFRLHAASPREISVTLDYGGYDHRYAPKLSQDGVSWRALESARVSADDEAGTATLQLSLPAGTTFVAAQPVITPGETLAWARRTLARAGFEEIEYGRSVEGRPLVGFTGGAGDDLIVAFTRQHPPELTGAAAFRAFVETLAADSDDARAFRARHRIVLAPMPNPDGVAGGHWRLNAGGVDLNRDWGAFAQPETQALRDLIEREAEGRRVVAFIDFHSTRRNVVYAPPLDAPSPTIVLLPFLQTRYDAVLPEPLPWQFAHNANAGVSKAWGLERFGAPAITLELSDDASDEEMRVIGATTAEALFEFFASTPDEAADETYPGARRFRFTAWPGPPLNVWLYRAADAGADAPVLFVMHGVGRDADRYLREWAPLAETHGAVLVAPEFSRDDFPGAANYNLGAVFDDSGAARPRHAWSYAALEPIFDAIVAREDLSATGYSLYGHSAGGQFVHRFALLGAGPRLERAVAANAGWYTFPDESAAWPFGLRDGPPAPEAEQRFAAPLHILIGDADNDPNHPSLSRSDGAMAQGPHRFARGQSFYAAARRAAAESGVALSWTCSIAPGLAHENGVAAHYAAPLLFGPAPRATGRCETLTRR